MTKWPQDNQAALIAFYGDPGKGQVEAQLVHVTPPFRMTYEGTPVGHLVFHKKAADALLAALNTVWDYYGRDQAKLDALGISKTAGTFNKRFIRGSDWKWSNHAYGAAIDINAEENGFNVAGNIPRVMVAAFKAQGARWGGDYHGRTDPMHFEFCDSGEEPKSFDAWLAHYGVTAAPATADPPATPANPPAPSPAATPVTSGIAISDIADKSAILNYHWRDRGIAPAAYIRGMALTFAQTYRRFKAGHPATLEMAKARPIDDDDEHDALSWYHSNFTNLGMANDGGADTLRHLFVLMLGVGMRESSGKHCCGRDRSASNTSADTAEAGLFQTSYNAHTCHPTFDQVMDEFAAGKLDGYLPTFSHDVSCSQGDWDNAGTGRGVDFQRMCKNMPAFAAESAAITLRNLRKHYGTVNRKEAELRKEADDLFREIQAHVDQTETA